MNSCQHNNPSVTFHCKSAIVVREIKVDCLKESMYLQVSSCFNVLWQLRGTVIKSALYGKAQTPQILLGIVHPQSNND